MSVDIDIGIRASFNGMVMAHDLTPNATKNGHPRCIHGPPLLRMQPTKPVNGYCRFYFWPTCSPRISTRPPVAACRVFDPAPCSPKGPPPAAAAISGVMTGSLPDPTYFSSGGLRFRSWGGMGQEKEGREEGENG